MTSETYVEFKRNDQAWTVGVLRKALEGLPDDALVVVDPEQRAETDGYPSDTLQVIYDGRMGQDWVSRPSGETTGHLVPANRFELSSALPFPEPPPPPTSMSRWEPAFPSED